MKSCNRTIHATNLHKFTRSCFIFDQIELDFAETRTVCEDAQCLETGLHILRK